MSKRPNQSRKPGSITVTLNSIDEENVQRDVKGTRSMADFSSSSSGLSVTSTETSDSAFNLKKGLLKAKECLQRGEPIALYDHLSDVVQQVLSTKINDAVSFVESISKDVKDARCLYSEDNFRDVFKEPKNKCEIKRMNSLYMSLFVPSVKEIVLEDEEDVEKMFEFEDNLNPSEEEEETREDFPKIQNFIETNNYMKQAGFGLPDWEIYDVAVSVMRLVRKIKNVFFKIRFFGKVFGTHKVYYVLETEFTLKELERCRKIQSEKEELLSEEANAETTSGLMSKEEEKEGFPEVEVETVQHEDIVNVITEKSKKEVPKQESEHRVSGSLVEGSLVVESQKSVYPGEGSAEEEMDQISIPVIETPSEIAAKEQTIKQMLEEMAHDIINDIVFSIMECIAVGFLKQIDELMPVLPPEPVLKPPVVKEVPAEGIGEGLNKTVFWVCNNLEDEWICLPDVSPKHIDIARKINNGFSGDLEADVKSYPPFEGKEKHYLRAQLARISSSTAVSPLGYYMKGVEGLGDEEDDEEAMLKAQESVEDFTDNFDFENEEIDVKQNPRYRNRSMSHLANDSLVYWVHHRKEIKLDGRITWWTEEEDTGLENEREGSENETLTTGNDMSRIPHPLFKSLSRESDWSDYTKMGWKVCKHPSYIGGPNIVTLKCLRWPGAFAFVSADGKSDCIYIGWGQKSYPKGFFPKALSPFSLQYEDMAECLDPSVTDEEDQLDEGDPPLRIKKNVKQPSYEMEDTDDNEEDILGDSTEDSGHRNSSDNSEEE